jgi:hypothetical protein
MGSHVILASAIADALGLSAAIWLIAALTFASGLVVAVRMTETLRPEPLGARSLTTQGA